MMNLIFLALFSLVGYAKVDLGLSFVKDEVKQGELAKAKLFFRQTDSQKFSPTSLKGKKIAKTVYFQNISAFVGKEGQGYYEADATVVFLTVPNTQTISELIDGEEISIVWKDLSVIATQAEKFELGSFDVPIRIDYVMWITGLVILSILIGLGKVIFEKIHLKRAVKERKAKLKEALSSCRTYEDVVTLWKTKKIYLQDFPGLEEAFSKLEVTLFKHQFKPQQTDSEKADVLKAYEKFKNDAQGVLVGI